MAMTIWSSSLPIFELVTADFRAYDGDEGESLPTRPIFVTVEIYLCPSDSKTSHCRDLSLSLHPIFVTAMVSRGINPRNKGEAAAKFIVRALPGYMKNLGSKQLRCLCTVFVVRVWHQLLV